jgi:HEAT repeat protein
MIASMTRRQVIDSLLGMLGPLGPFGDLAQREAEEAAWAARAAGDPAVMAEILDLARHPATANERGRISEASFQSQLAHVLALAGAGDPATVLDGLGQLTQDARARAIAIEAIGAIGEPAGLRWLAPLVDARDLSDEEATSLACAFGDIGTAEAGALLERLRNSMPLDRSTVHREIQIAGGAISRRLST